MHITRREFLGIATASAVSASAFAREPWSALERPAGRLLSAKKTADGRYVIAGMELDGQNAFAVDVPWRGHGVVVNPITRNRAVVLARRPGTYACELNLAEGRVSAEFESAPDRHFYGHGCYSKDGQYLYSTENDFERGRGVVTVRDSVSYEVLGEFPSHGVGPHDIHLMAGGKTLVVANGGIRTHPGFGRRKLNRDDMEPSLAYIDAESGRLLCRFELPERRLSIRHLHVTRDGTVGIALQYEGDGAARVAAPLVAVQKGQEQIRLFIGSESELLAMRGYAADICIHAAREIAGVTAPRGDLVTFWDVRRRRFIKALPMRDPSGIALSRRGDYFIVSNGIGELHFISTHNLQLIPSLSRTEPNAHWDNHLTLG